MLSKSDIEELMKKNNFISATSYPPQNGFLDYGPALAKIKQKIISEYKKVFLDEDVYEIEPSAILPYEVLKNSGHIDKFCDIILTDGESIVRADHYLEEKIGDEFMVPDNLKAEFGAICEKIEKFKQEIISNRHKSFKTSKSIEKSVSNLDIRSEYTTTQFTKDEVNSILSNFDCVNKKLSDFDKHEIDFVVFLHNLHSPNNKPFNPAKDFNLIFKINERQFLRPELAQCVFTNFRRLYDMNNEKLPFAGMVIGRSYRNEISARGGMQRTKEFEQAEIEYFTEDGKHKGFESIRKVEVLLLPNSKEKPFIMSLGEAFEKKVISSESVCYFIAKAQEFLLNMGFKLESFRFRQHYLNEMAHYANDCWDLEIKTLSGWLECAGIADRASFDLTVHSKDVNSYVKRTINPKKVYEISLNKPLFAKELKDKFKDFERVVSNLSQEYISTNCFNGILKLEFDKKIFDLTVTEKMVDFELFIPRVIEPSFGISRLLYCLVEQGFNIRDGRTVLSLKPKMCYIQCVITFLKYLDEFEPYLKILKSNLKAKSIEFKTNERGCSIGRKYSSCDEIGVPFFITFDFETLNDKKVTIRERDTTSQIRVPLESVPDIIESLILETYDWSFYTTKFGLFN